MKSITNVKQCSTGSNVSAAGSFVRSNGAQPKAVAGPEPGDIRLNGKSPVSEMHASIEHYAVDRGSLARSYPVVKGLMRRY